jgi:hypothetical protein
MRRSRFFNRALKKVIGVLVVSGGDHGMVRI